MLNHKLGAGVISNKLHAGKYKNENVGLSHPTKERKTRTLDPSRGSVVLPPTPIQYYKDSSIGVSKYQEHKQKKAIYKQTLISTTGVSNNKSEDKITEQE